MSPTLTRRTVPALCLSALIAIGTRASSVQAQKAAPAQPDHGALPAFEVATIRPVDPNAGGPVGFYCRPGGRVFLGFASVKTMITYAFHVQDYQVVGGPDWTATERYNVTAIPPDSSPSRTAAQPDFAATPSEEQRQMLQRLLIDRFGLTVHRESREGPVFLLTRGKKALQLKEPEHKDGDPRGAVNIKQGGIADGSAFGENITMPFLAEQLGGRLGAPVLDHTGIAGAYDFEIKPIDPENHHFALAAFEAMDQLGLKLERAKGPIDVVVIDQVDRPSPN